MHDALYAGIGIESYDPVADFKSGKPVPGSRSLTREWKGVTWRFASVANRDAFVKEPARYAPQYGGFCSWGVVQGKPFNVDPVRGWKIVDGKLSMNFNADIQKTWEKDIPGFIAKAQTNWPALNQSMHRPSRPTMRRPAIPSRRSSVAAPSSDIAFTPSVKAVQDRKGSRATYAKMEARGGFRTTITPELVAFLAEIDTAYLATASAEGQPYAQHRGGPKGFIRVLDERTLGFADYRGNRQFITAGNLAENDRVFLFLMDYANLRRVKIWGRARIVEDDSGLIGSLMPEGYEARPEQAVLIAVDAWDVNCPQHIPQKLNGTDVADAISRLQARIAALEEENAFLRASSS